MGTIDSDLSTVRRGFIIYDVGISIMSINAIARGGSSNERIGSTRRTKLGAMSPVLLDGQDALDRALIESIADGDKRAMQVLYARHNVRIYRFIEHLIGNASVAEDLVSDVFLDVWRNANGFEAKFRVSTWLLAIARHKALSALKRRSHEPLDERTTASVEDPADDPEITMHKTVRSAIIRRCLGRLSSAHREVMNLVYYQDKSIEEVATIVRAPTNTVKTRMFYARRQLAELLREAGRGWALIVRRGLVLHLSAMADWRYRTVHQPKRFNTGSRMYPAHRIIHEKRHRYPT
jgi:RNA polymerase sigma-70 factor (ECF subfamily)